MHVRSRLPVLAAILLFLTVASVSTPRRADGQSTLYDNFSATKLDPDRWFGQQVAAFGPAGEELIREVRGRRLFLSHRIVSDATTDVGVQTSHNVLSFPVAFANSITAIAFNVQVTKFAIQGCPANGAVPEINAGVRGVFFNDGSGGPGDATGDMQVNFGLRRQGGSTDRPSVLRASGELLRCDNPQCSSVTLVALVDLGPVNRGATARLRLKWDQSNHVFEFQKNNDLTFYQPYPGYSDTAVGQSSKFLEAFGLVPNCTTPPQPFAEVSAYFDNVFVNP